VRMTFLVRRIHMMKKQRTNEWTKYTDHELSYHTLQWENQKDSTLAFYKFAEDKINSSESIIDLGAGAGAATSYLASRNSKARFVAADYVQDYLNIGNEIAKKKQINNLEFKKVEWYALENTKDYEGVVSLQTLSWLPEPREPMKQVFEKLNPKWFALTSLFYDGDISCTIEVNEHEFEKKSFYNIYAIPEIKRIAEEYGYRLSKMQKFELSFDIEKPKQSNRMGTYTKEVPNIDGSTERLQMSGPIMMPWYMLMFEPA
jgi:SAM-dependent methyltransferase